MAISDPNLLTIDAGILHKDACIIIVRTEWNSAIVNKLEEGCLSVLDHYGMMNRKVLTVPGAFEIPFGIKSYWDKCSNKLEKPKVFIALGCVLRGDTPHFDYVCKAVTDGIVHLNLTLSVPTIFGVLTLDTKQQAEDRTGGIHGNKGEEAAATALKMLILGYQHL